MSEDKSTRNTSSSAIDHLSDDVLHEIFMLNTTSFTVRPENHSLTHSISTSQVCSSWRKIMLESPFLWARLMDWSHKSFASESWRTEMLRRTGDAPLWLQGSIRSSDESLNQFIFYIFDNHWERIQRLEIDHIYLGTVPLDKTPRGAFERAAPNLEIFSIPHTFEPRLISTSPSPLFAGYAPRLRVLYTVGLAFNLSVPWISNIREIRFDKAFDLSDVFGALGNMPLLEKLGMYSLKNRKREGFDKYPKVYFHHLEDLNFQGPIPTLLLMLNTIQTPPGCSFFISTATRETEFEQEDHALEDVAARQLSDSIRSAIGSWTPTEVAIKSHNSVSYGMLDIGMAFEALEGRASSFAIHLRGYKKLPKLLLTELSTIHPLTQAKRLVLQVIGFEGPLDGPLKTLFLSLPLISVLVPSEDAIEFMLETDSDNVFPCLRVLRLSKFLKNDLWPRRWSRKYPHGPVMSFLQRRSELGLPVDVIDIAVSSFSQLYDMDFLEGVSGLKVRYRDSVTEKAIEYLCGSGNPDFLKFASRASMHDLRGPL